MHAMVNGTKNMMGDNIHAYNRSVFLKTIRGSDIKLLIQISPIIASFIFLSNIKKTTSGIVISNTIKKKKKNEVFVFLTFTLKSFYFCLYS